MINSEQLKLIEELRQSEERIDKKIIDLRCKIKNLERMKNDIKNTLYETCEHNKIVIELSWDGHRNQKSYHCQFCKLYISSQNVNLDNIVKTIHND